MSRKRNRTNKSFVMIGRGMLLRSIEWKSLTPSAKLLYLYLKAKYDGSNNGEIQLHYSELKGVQGISSDSTVSKAFRELEKKGWIKRTKFGGLYRYINKYKLTGNYDDHLLQRY